MFVPRLLSAQSDRVQVRSHLRLPVSGAGCSRDWNRRRLLSRERGQRSPVRAAATAPTRPA